MTKSYLRTNNLIIRFEDILIITLFGIIFRNSNSWRFHDLHITPEEARELKDAFESWLISKDNNQLAPSKHLFEHPSNDEISISELEADVASALERGLSGKFAFTPETVLGLINKIKGEN